jgi:uncharacterized phage protein (TIGR02216 family)
MRFGLGVLRLSPAQFWAMTPRELHAASHPESGGAMFTRRDLLGLMQAFPDEVTQ